MGKKDLVNFIESIPDHKLTGLLTSTSGNPLHKDGTFRFDMQGMTSDKPPKHNLQIQVNHKPKIASYDALAPVTIAGPVLAPSGKNAWTADKIRAEFRARIVKFGGQDLDQSKKAPAKRTQRMRKK